MNYRFTILLLFLETAMMPGFTQEYQNQPEYNYFPCEKSTTGCYESFKKFSEGIPILTTGFHMEPRYSNEIRDSRAGGYFLEFDEGKPPAKTATNHIWGVYYDDTLYINRKFFQGKKGFDKVYCLGSFGYFHGINPKPGTVSENSIYASTILFGLVGGVVSGVADNNRNNLYGKFPRVMIYLLDYETGMVSPLTSFKLEKILEPDPELLEMYIKEKNRFSMMVMHAYLDTFAERHRNQ
jgi:hypothetical protein